MKINKTKLRKFIAKILTCLIFDKYLRKHLRKCLVNFSIKEYLYYRFFNYKIVSLGSFCLPRVITTAANLKPRKIYGEKSCPFDLCFHSDIKKIIECINSSFPHYFRGLYYDKKTKWWFNPEINAAYNHDPNLTKKEFKKRYKNRIKNFQKILKTKEKIYFIYSNYTINELYPKTEDIKKLYDALSSQRGAKPFELILILPQKIENINNENIHQIIKECPQLRPEWVIYFLEAAKGLETEKTEPEHELYFYLKSELEKIIK